MSPVYVYLCKCCLYVLCDCAKGKDILLTTVWTFVDVFCVVKVTGSQLEPEQWSSACEVFIIKLRHMEDHIIPD